MQTYIIKPLEILETEDIKALAERLKNETKVYIISGIEKAGKTALAVKILSYLMKENPEEFKPLVISLDNSVAYWQKSMQLDEGIFRYPFKNKSFGPIGNGLCALLLMRINVFVSPEYNLIIIDGINKGSEVLGKKYYEAFFNSIVSFAKDRKVNYLITCRTELLCLSHSELVQSLKDDFVELWDLERPDIWEGR